MTSALFLTALGLLLLIEGALYALFPKAMQRAMTQLAAASESVLRLTGLAAAGAGFVLIAFLYT